MAEQEMKKPRVALIVLSVLFATPTAFAQDRPDPADLTAEQREELADLLSRAKKAYEAGNYLESIEALQASHEIFPEPNILYRIGDAYERLGDLERAVEFYQAYTEADPSASDRNLILRRIDDLERRIAELQEKLQAPEPQRAALLLDTNPAGAVVTIDGGQVADPTPVRVEVEPGAHELRLEATGHLPIEREIELDDGETISLVYQLDAIPEPPEPSGRGPWPWILGGAGVASLGTAAGFLLAGSAANRQVERWDDEREAAYAGGEPIPDRPARYDVTVRNRVVFRNVGFVAGGIGTLTVLGSVAWLLFGGGESDDAASARLKWSGAAVGVWW